nr:HD domain-containing protein [Clostridium paraputrificum]
MVVDKGSSYRDYVEDKKVFMWALLLHDLGKRSTTKLRNGRWTSYDHDKVGRKDSYDFLSCFNLDEEFKTKVSILVRYHMHLLFIMNKLPYGDIKGMKKEANLHDLSYVFLSDRLGRGGMDKEEIEKVEKEVESFRNKFFNMKL